MVFKRYDIVNSKHKDSNIPLRLLEELISKDHRVIKTNSKNIAISDLHYASILIDSHNFIYPLTIIGETYKKIDKARSYLDEKLKNHNFKLIDIID